MKIDPFVLSVASDIDISIEVDNVEKLREVLAEEAKKFLLAGGTIDIATWSGLSEISRDAFVAAGDEIRRATASYTGISAQGPEQAKAVASGIDGDDLRVRIALETIVGRRKTA